MAVLRTYYNKGYTMEGLHHIIRQGRAAEFIHIGDQIYTTFDEGSMIFDVIGLDAEKPVNNNIQHTVTLQARTLIEPRKFDKDCMNRWEKSDLREYLNSEKFKERFPEMAQYLVEVYKENEGRDQTRDTFFLLSKEEYGDGGHSIYGYYSRNEDSKIADIRRVKADESGNTQWHWTRSENRGDEYSCEPNSVWNISDRGVIYDEDAKGECYYAPACVIA